MMIKTVTLKTLTKQTLSPLKSGIIAAALLTSSLSWAGSPVNYQVNGKDYQGYWSQVSTEAPTIVIVHDWDGLTDYEQQRADMLNEQGYNVFALDMFGKGLRPTTIDDKKALTGALYKDRSEMRARVSGAMKAAEQQGADLSNAVLLGYCFGGSVTLEAARAGFDMKGFAGFHAGLATPTGEDYSKLKGNVILFHGSADRVVPMTDFADIVSRMESAGVNHEAITYSGARHAFSVIGSDRYDAKADQLSWNRFSEYLATTLKP